MLHRLEADAVFLASITTTSGTFCFPSDVSSSFALVGSPLRAQRLLQFLHNLVNDGASERPLNGSPGTRDEIRLVQMGIIAAIPRAVFVDAAQITL